MVLQRMTFVHEACEREESVKFKEPPHDVKVPRRTLKGPQKSLNYANINHFSKYIWTHFANFIGKSMNLDL